MEKEKNKNLMYFETGKTVREERMRHYRCKAISRPKQNLKFCFHIRQQKKKTAKFYCCFYFYN